MFYSSHFTGDISKWNISNVKDSQNIFKGCPIEDKNKPAIKLEESFDFNKVNKEKKQVNIFEVLQKELKEHLDKLDFNYITDEMYQLLITEKGFYKVYNLTDLTNIVRETVKYFGPNCNLNWIDVSGVRRMNFLFKDSEFNGDISEWDVSNVNDMEGIFMDSDFNGDISKWDVSSVEDMQNMFNGSKFNGILNLMVIFLIGMCLMLLIWQKCL